MSQNKIACLFVLLSFLLPALLSAEPPRENPWAAYVEPDRELQELLRCLAALPDRSLTQSERDKLLSEVRARQEFCENKLLGLESLAGGRRELLLQLLCFDGASRSHYESTAVLGFLKTRNMGLPDLLAATARFLESEDGPVRRKAEEFLLAAQVSDPDDISVEQVRDRPDFTVLAETFRRERDAVPRGLEPLARHMFAKDPEQALRRLADVYLDGSRRDELLAMLDGVKAGNGTERELLRKLVAPDHWWSEKWFVQLYVAEKTCSNDDLADEEVLKQLKATEQLIVWQRLKRAEAEEERANNRPQESEQ